MQNAVINFFDEKNVATITNASFKYKLKKESIIFKLNGNFLNDKISINFDNNLSKANQSKILILKLADAKLFTKMELINSKLNNNITSGNILFKKNQTKIIGIFDYKNNKIIIKNANLRNSFLDSKFSGEVQFLPYLNFNLDIDLSTLNFNRLYNFLITLNKEERKKLFKINKKLNGAFNVSVDKIYSKYTFIDTFESRIRFVNGDIVFEQLLLNLKKLGAVDVTGIIKNEEKFSIFKFEQNIFIDNLKTFFSRFGIHNKKKIPYDLFVAGNLNLTSFILHLHEISSASKFEEEDINYIEREFNDILLNKDYESFFNFVNLKEFVQSISLESN